MQPDRTAYNWVDLQEKECKVVSAHDIHFDAQVSILENKANIKNCLELE